MFRVERSKKLGLLIMGASIFSLVHFPGIHFKVSEVLCFAFFLSEIKHFKSTSRFILRNTTFTKFVLLLVLSIITTVLSSPHLNNAHDIFYFIIFNYILCSCALFYAFLGINRKINYASILKATTVAILILTFFGVLNYITKRADFIEIMSSNLLEGTDLAEQFSERDRFRVQSMFQNPFNYGYICTMILLLHIYGFIKKLENKTIFLLVLICALFGIFTCGCRTVVFVTIISVTTFFLFAFSLKRKLRYFSVTMLLCVFAYMSVPFIQEKVDSIFTMFDSHSEVEGSSTTMRQEQYLTVYSYIQDHLLFGRGYNFFVLDLGWSNSKELLKDTRLQGLEGVLLSRMLERGLVGVTLYLVFYFLLIRLFYKHRKTSKEEAAMGLAIIIAYLCFANMTGELLSVFPTLLCVGIFAKIIIIDKRIQKKQLYVIYRNNPRLQAKISKRGYTVHSRANIH
jgi:O-antigen ligase